MREDIIELELSQKELSGSLSLVEFTSLQKLNCSRNKLIELNLSNYSQLIEIGCHDNELFGIKITGLHQLKTLNAWNNCLTELGWEVFNPKNLVSLSLSNNNLKKQSLTFLFWLLSFLSFMGHSGELINLKKKKQIIKELKQL